MSNDIVEPPGVPEFFTDGVSAKVIDGVVRTAWHRRQGDEARVVVRLALPATELPDVIRSLAKALRELARDAAKPS